ncbi:Nucleoporin GLE1 [Hordeum vulgare]|nr:Nucleoporin GLE1 [Hordeum vulgare]
MVNGSMTPGDPTMAMHPASEKKAPEKPRSELTPAEPTKLNVESAKMWNRHTKDKEKKVAADFTTKMDALGVVQHKAFQSLEAFKARHKNNPFTLRHCWALIKDCPKFKDQYAACKKKGGKAVVADEGDLLKRPRGKTTSKADEKCDAASIVLQGTLKNMMSQKKVMGDVRSKEKEEQIKVYLDLQKKKFEMEKVVKRRNLDIEEAAQLKKLEIKDTNVETKEKEVALAFMSLDKSNMSPERKTWFAKRRKEMFARGRSKLGDTLAAIAIYFEGSLMCRQLPLLSAPKTCPF